MKKIVLTILGVVFGGLGVLCLGLVAYIFLGALITQYICCGDYPDIFWSKVLIGLIVVVCVSIWIYIIKIFRRS